MKLGKNCPECKAPLPTDAPYGLCPKCLIKEAGPDIFLSTAGGPSPLTANALLEHPELRDFGDYELLEELGRGGMGIVFKARQKRLNRLVALKMVSMGHLAGAESIDRFRAEAEAAAGLQHPNIVVIHEFGEVKGSHYFSMEWVDGLTLTALRLQQPRKVLAWDYLAPLLLQLCDALEYAHNQKVIHRDLKPANMMVDRHGRLKLADFGLAAVVAEVSSMTGLQPSSGTLTHMSPQQLDGRTPRITDDIYSVGATLYELLTGRPPFYTGDVLNQVRQVMPEPIEERLEALGIDNPVPAAVRSLIMACLAKDPAQRPQSAQEIRDRLQPESTPRKAASMRLSCPHCSQTMEIDSGLAGQNLQCPTCQKGFAVPAMPSAMAAEHTSGPTPVIAPNNAKVMWASVALGIVLLVVAGILFATRKPPVAPAESKAIAAPSPTPPSVSPAPPPPQETDFIPLFNGRDLTGWGGGTGTWKVQNGSMIGEVPAKAQKGTRGHIHWTNEVVGDFELRFSFRVPTGISGLIYRSQDFGHDERFGYEFVITDQKRSYSEIGQLFESGAQGSRPARVPGRGHLGTPGTKVRVEHGRRILPDGTPKSTVAQAIRAVKLDDWNEGMILAQGRRLTHWVNGVVITEVEDNEVMPDRLSGAIGFKVASGSRAEFKNIWIKKLGVNGQQPSTAVQPPGAAIVASSSIAATGEKVDGAAPLRIDWQQAFGGSADDEFASIQAVPGGGYLLTGSSSSPPGGNKTSASFGSMDWWIIRVDEQGNRMWEKSFGGSGSDLLKRVEPLRAGGFLLYGFTESPMDGNKTTPQFGKGDGWMIRIDSSGEKLWEKAFGGSDWDNINDVRETSDGDLIVAMRSASTISGNKSSPNYGSHDGVLLRLNSNGERKWEHSFGGPGSDGFECVRELPNGDFIVAGYSGSQTPGGNMTARPTAAFDHWAMRVDKMGSKIWERVYGGEKADSLFDVHLASSGLVLFSGGSMSPPGIEKSGPAYGDMDIWVVQLDEHGAKIWDQSYGGLDFDGRGRIAPNAGGYLIAGSSKSGKSGNKTTASFGKLDFWLLGISLDGTKRWEQSFGGSDDDELLSVIPTRDGGFLIAGFSASPADGNKSVPNFGNKDAWVVKLSPRSGNRGAQNTIPAPQLKESLDARQTANKMAEIAGSIGGIGAVLEKTNGALRIKQVRIGSPAQRVGLQAGAEIVSINGESTHPMELEDAVKRVRGPIGSELKLEIRNQGGANVPFSLVREKVLISPVESQRTEDGLLLLQPGYLSSETPAVLRDLLSQNKNVSGIVLDLRASPGGLIEACEQVAALFLSKNSTLWFERAPGGSISERKSRETLFSHLPLVVLADRKTSGGGELVAAALQRNHRAKVVGQPTSGFISTNPMKKLVKDGTENSRLVAQGFNWISRDGSITNVAPDRFLSDSSTDLQYMEAARELLSQASKSATGQE